MTREEARFMARMKFEDEQIARFGTESSSVGEDFYTKPKYIRAENRKLKGTPLARKVMRNEMKRWKRSGIKT